MSFDGAVGAAGLYAFVLEGPVREVLYVGKAGGVKPGSNGVWANDVATRVRHHWSTGPFRGLVETTAAPVDVWFLDLRRAVAPEWIWERDLEAIEGVLIRWLRSGSALPGNRAIEGSSPRAFQVTLRADVAGVLPLVMLEPGTMEESRTGVRRRLETRGAVPPR